ncbi:hypothetical protein MMC24_006903 [Lignoscripta atroalba]|nr:hypothetical protein [Lignoscripta atroalba]
MTATAKKGVIAGTATNLVVRGLGLAGRGSGLVVISLVFTSIAIVSVALRIASRFKFAKCLGWDDYAILFSLVSSSIDLHFESFGSKNVRVATKWLEQNKLRPSYHQSVSISMGVINCVAVNHGFGRLSTTLSSYNLHTALKDFWVLQILYKVTINTTKISILLLYLRIFPSKGFRRAVFAVMTFVLLYASASIIATVLECKPINRVWNKSLPGSCINLTAFWYSNAAANILGDLAILALPMPKIKALHLPFRHKLGLFLVFAVGGFVCLTSILRMTTLNPASKSNDQTFGTLISTTWTTIEANTGIICACLPVLKAPLSLIFPRLFSSHISIGENISLGRRNRRAAPAPNSQPNSPINPGIFKKPMHNSPTNESNASGGRPTTSESREPIFRFDSTRLPMGAIKKTTDVRVQIAEASSTNSSCSHVKDQGISQGPNMV